MKPDDEILAIFEESSDPFLGTAEVADVLDYSPQGTSKRLDELVEKSKLMKKLVGNTAIYWLPSRVN